MYTKQDQVCPRASCSDPNNLDLVGRAYLAPGEMTGQNRVGMLSNPHTEVNYPAC